MASASTLTLLAPVKHHLSGTCGLPRLAFDCDCRLNSINQAARDLFGSNGAFAGQDLGELFPYRDLRAHVAADEAQTAHSPARDRLELLADKCSKKSWGEGVTLEYVVDGHTRRAEATVVNHPNDDDQVPNGFTILFLRSLPNLIEGFDRLNLDVIPSDESERTIEDKQSIEYAVAGLAKGLTGAGMTDEEMADPSMLGGKVLTFEELTQLVNEFPQICFTSRPDGFVDWINKQWYQYTGLPMGVPISIETWVSFFHQEDLPQALAAWHTGLRESEEFKFEYRVRGSEGGWRWKVAMGRPMRDAVTGEITSWACTITDVNDRVTAQKEAEAARLEAERVNERMRTVLSSASVLLLCVDLETRLTFSEGSAAVASSLGASLTESSIGQPLSDVWPDLQLQESVRKMLKPDAPANVSFRTDITSPAGTRHFQYRLSALTYSAEGQDSVKQGLIIVGSDISHIIATEAALEKSRYEQTQLAASELAAREASKLKDLFMQTLSHEIRTPISTVSAICELLLGDANLSNEQRALVNQALRSSNILLDLVGLVLDLRKVEAGALTLEDNPFLVADVVEDCKLFEVPCKAKGIKFAVDVDPNLWPGHVMGDRLRLRQILTNGLANAIKFTHEGSVTLKVRQTAETATQVGTEWLVQDDGIGISEAEIKTLFKPFQQANAATAREFGGTGLGLTIARNLAELMGGTVDLTSEQGKGTTMTVRVTLAKQPKFELTNAIDSLDTDIRAHRFPGKIHILLADDNDILRQVFTKTLERMKFKVTTVNDGQEAVDLVRTEPFDLVLMDQQMPNLDGLEATRLIRADPNPRVAKMVVIALTAGVVAGNREMCLAAGSNFYLSKPVRASDLEAAIWEQLELAEKRQALAREGEARGDEV